MAKKKWAYVPGKQDWMNSRIHDDAQYVGPEADLSCHLICDESDQNSLNRFQNFLDDVHAVIRNHYLHSGSTGWTPQASDEVFWFSTPTQSQILNPIVESDFNAEHQSESECNCYKTRVEVEELRDKIKVLISAYKF